MHVFGLTRPSSNSKVPRRVGSNFQYALPSSSRDVSLQASGSLNARIIMTHKNNLRGQLEECRIVACFCGQLAVQYSVQRNGRGETKGKGRKRAGKKQSKWVGCQWVTVSEMLVCGVCLFNTVHTYVRVGNGIENPRRCDMRGVNEHAGERCILQ